MKSMRCVIPVILLSFIVHEGTAKPTAQIHFMGSVVEAGCWNDVGTLKFNAIIKRELNVILLSRILSRRYHLLMQW